MSSFQRFLPAILIALGVLAFHGTAWESQDDLHRSVDVNSMALEDFEKTYFPMGQRVFDGIGPVPNFLYSPTFALLLGAFGGVPIETARTIWGVFEALATLALVLLPLALFPRVGGLARNLYLVAALASFPILHNAHWGQVSAPVTTLVLAALAAYVRGARVACAALLGIAISIKFYPAFFLVCFLLREDLRTVALTVGVAFGLMVAVPVAVLGAGETVDFYRAVGAGLEHAETSGELWRDATNKQYLAAVLTRWIGPRGPGLYIAAQMLGFVWAGLHLFLIRRRLGAGTEGVVLSFALTFLTLPLVLSPSWPHYFVFLPFCQLAVLVAVLRAGARSLAGGLCLTLLLVSAGAASVFWFRWVDDSRAYGESGTLLLANLAVLVALYVTLASGGTAGVGGGVAGAEGTGIPSRSA